MDKLLSRRSLTASLILFFVLAIHSPATAQDAKRLEVDEANFLLEGFERYVGGLEGKEGVLTKDAKRALTKIATLKKNHPEDQRVAKLFERAQAAARLLKGDRIKVTKEMLAYRDIEQKRIELLAKQNQEAWRNYQSKLLTENPKTIVKALPARNPVTTSLDKMKGRPVILSGIRYPDGVFLHYGQPYLAIGSPAQGYYYIDASSQSFIGAYEAVRRYQRTVSDQIPEEWTGVGTITSKRLLVPEGGDRKQGQAFNGWVIEINALYVKDRVFAVADPDRELGGSYAGEDSVQDDMASLYSVNRLPEGENPEDLLEVFVTAIKEKNFALYEQCIHPEERRTLVQKNWVERKWDIFQRRFKSEIVEVRVGKKDPIRILAGGASSDDKSILGEFLDESEVEEIADDGRKRSEMVTLWLKLYDETGRIREYQKPLSLKRDEDVDGFRWFIKSGFPF